MVKYINYKGEKLPYRVTIYANRKYYEETGEEFVESFSKVDSDPYSVFKKYEIILYYALIAGHEFEGKEFKISRDKMEFLVDVCFENPTEFLKEFSSFFYQKTDEEIKSEENNTEEEKKN